MKKIIIASIVVVSVFSAGYAVYSKLQTDQTKQVEAALKADALTTTAADADALYVANLSAQHADALPLLQLAQARAKHQELKQLATDFIEIIQTEQQAMSALNINPADTTTSQQERLPRYVSINEFQEITTNLSSLEGDDFDKQFLEYLRIQILSDNLLGYKIIEQTTNQSLRSFADTAVKDRLRLSDRQSEWPEQWGYAPPHDG